MPVSSLYKQYFMQNYAVCQSYLSTLLTPTKNFRPNPYDAPVTSPMWLKPGIHGLTIFSDKFKKPALKRVRISADQMLKTLLGSKGKATQVDMRSQLKKK